MRDSIVGKIIVILIIIILLIGFIPINNVYAFNFQVEDSQLDFSGEDPTEDEGEVDTPPVRSVSFLEQKLVEVVHSLLDSLREFFGLYSIDQLIFNNDEAKIILGGEGVEETATTVEAGGHGGVNPNDVIAEINGESIESPKRDLYYGGVMPESWFNIARSMHLIFQSIAWSLLGFSIVKNLLQINLGTINPMMRFRFYDGIRDLFMTGFLLIGALLIVETLFVLNVRLVDIFEASTNTGNFRSMYYNRGDLGSAFIQIFYLFIEGYLNFVYIMRAISTAILIATAPLFIVSISFEGKNVLFMKWLRELTSNIFLQSFHAFMLSFLLSIQFSATGFENMVIMFSLIPLTDFFRSLILGESKGAANTLGMGAVSAGIGTVAGAAGALEGNKRDAKKNDKHSSGKGDESSNTGTPSNTTFKKGPRESSEYGPADKATKNSLDSLKEDRTAGEGFMMKDAPNAYEQMSTAKDVDGKSDALKDTLSYKAANKVAPGHATQAAAGAQVGKNAAKTIASAGSVIGGAGIAMVTGGKYGGKMAGKGLGNIAPNAKNTFNSARDAKNITDDLKNGNDGGNMMFAERMSNGHTAIHRDKGMINNDGLIGATSDGRSGIHNLTYNPNGDGMSSDNKLKLAKIEKEFELNSDKTALRENYGIENVSRDKNNNIQIRANKTYLEHMGIDSVYHTNNRHVETKRPGQSLRTDIVPDFRVSPQAERAAKTQVPNTSKV